MIVGSLAYETLLFERRFGLKSTNENCDKRDSKLESVKTNSHKAASTHSFSVTDDYRPSARSHLKKLCEERLEAHHPTRQKQKRIFLQ